MAQLPEQGAAVDVPRSLTMDDAATAFDDIAEGEGETVGPEAEQFEDIDPEADEGDEPEAEEGDDEDADEGEPETAIAPPASLTAEEKAAWAQLPPEAQQTLVAIEARRTAEVQTGLEKARSAQREAESAAAGRVAEAQRLFAEQQATLAQRYVPAKPNPQHYPDWQTYSDAQARYEAASAQHNDLMQQLNGLHAEAMAEQERLDAQALQAQWKAVQNDLPEAADPAQWSELITKLSPLALELGYPEELLADATPTDIRAIKRAAEWKADADKYKALMSRQMSKVRSGKSAKPNAAQPVGSGKARASAKVVERYRSNPSSMQAAAAAFEDI